MDYKNYVQAKSYSPFSRKYMYFDTKDFLADMTFVKYNVPVKFFGDYAKPESSYCCVFCKIRKKYEPDFLKALEELKTKMLVLGHTDYEEFCLDMQEKLKER